MVLACECVRGLVKSTAYVGCHYEDQHNLKCTVCAAVHWISSSVHLRVLTLCGCSLRRVCVWREDEEAAPIVLVKGRMVVVGERRSESWKSERHGVFFARHVLPLNSAFPSIEAGAGSCGRRNDATVAAPTQPMTSRRKSRGHVSGVRACVRSYARARIGGCAEFEPATLPTQRRCVCECRDFLSSPFLRSAGGAARTLYRFSNSRYIGRSSIVEGERSFLLSAPVLLSRLPREAWSRECERWGEKREGDGETRNRAFRPSPVASSHACGRR